MSVNKDGYFSVFRSNSSKFDNMLNNFIKAWNDGSVYLFEDIGTDDNFIDFFKDNQELRTAIYSYIYNNTNSILSKDIPEYVVSPKDMLDKKASMNFLAFKLAGAFKETIEEVDEDNLDLKDFARRMHRIIVEFALMTERNEERLLQLHYNDKKIDNDLDEIDNHLKFFEKYLKHLEKMGDHTYTRFDEELLLVHKKHKELKIKIDEVDNLKNEIDKMMKQITEELRAQKIDALTMTTLVFSAFTFLAVNAGIISGISQITDINISQMIKIFLVGNFTVLFGISFIIYLLKKIFDRE